MLSMTTGSAGLSRGPVFTLGDCFHHVIAVCDLAEDGVLAGEVRCRGDGDEELAAVGPGARVGHGQQTWLGEGDGRDDFVLEPVARAPGSSAGGVAALDHETVYDAVEDNAVVEFFAGQKDEAVDGNWSIEGEELDCNLAVVGLEGGRCRT